MIHDDAWKVIGGGKWYIDETLKTISLFDDSGMYGKFDHSGLKQKIESVEWLREFTVLIDGE
jgi:hypothetical protein